MESKQIIQKVEEGASGESIGEQKNTVCSFCEITETPLWRSGPLGPKTLCNACGIKYSKKRPRSPVADGSGASTSGGGSNEIEKKSKTGGEVEEEDEEWGEVERAALLLMALSCGVIFT